MTTPHLRAVWLSDIHLGSKDCQAAYLLNFLENLNTDILYLVGDIVDIHQMKKKLHWPESHNKVVHKIMQLSNSGTHVIYIPGNHDAPLVPYSGSNLGDIKVKRELVHKMKDGTQYLVLHGDQFDGDVALGKFETWLGDKGYTLLLILNRWYNAFRRWRFNDYWSLASHIKQHIRGANDAIQRFKHACTLHAKSRGLDGVICGHIHHPESSYYNGIHYINDGDWVEHCSVLIETEQGELKLLDWVQVMRQKKTDSPLSFDPSIADEAA